MRTFPNFRLNAFKDSDERGEVKKVIDHLRQVSGALSRSVFPGTQPAANPVSTSSGSTLPAPLPGDMLYGGVLNWSKLAIGTDGYLLQVASGSPAWGGLPVHDHSNAAQGGNIPETSITDGTLLARVAGNEVITGAWEFGNSGSQYVQVDSADGGIFDGLGLLIQGGTGFKAKLCGNSTQVADIDVILPATDGNLIGVNDTATVSNKTMAASTKIRCNTSTGTTFQDNSSTTKQMRFDVSGITAGSTRSNKWIDTAGSIVLTGNTTSASGVLGISDLTAQTGSITSTVLLTGNSTSAGFYRVACYMATTTAGTIGDVVKMTVTSNDGAAHTTDLVLWPASQTAPTTPILNHDLGTLNFASFGRAELYCAASQNIAFTTTVTKTGTPQYAIHVRIEAL